MSTADGVPRAAYAGQRAVGREQDVAQAVGACLGADGRLLPRADHRDGEWPARSRCQPATAGISARQGPHPGSLNTSRMGAPARRSRSSETGAPSSAGRANAGAGSPRALQPLEAA